MLNKCMKQNDGTFAEGDASHTAALGFILVKIWCTSLFGSEIGNLRAAAYQSKANALIGQDCKLVRKQKSDIKSI